jgi:Bacterial type II/III secretion system short domain
MKKRIATIVVLVFASLLFAGTAAADEVRIFKIQYRQAAELLDIVRPGLSPTGTASVDKRTNSLIVRDKAMNLRMIEKILRRSDVPMRNVMVKITEVGRSDLKELGINVDWQVKQGPWRAGNLEARDKDTLAKLSGLSRRMKSKKRSSSRLLVASGSRGQLVTGPRMPALGKMGAAEIQHVFLVQPVVVDNEVRISVSPTVVLYNERGQVLSKLDESELTFSMRDNGRMLIGGSSSRGTSTWVDTFRGASKAKAKSSSYFLLEVELR